MAGRPDPVELLISQDATREADLVPVRHGRMLVSPFTFYRGAARVMASDLARTPTAGLEVQLCGDAHLSNFGAYASPERQLVFGLNDFDETLPGPFEWDLKRMAASFTIAARNNGFNKTHTEAVTPANRSRPTGSRMAEFASTRLPGHLVRTPVRSRHQGRDARLPAGALSPATPSKDPTRGKKHAKETKTDKAEAARMAAAIKIAEKTLRKAHTRDSLQALPGSPRGRTVVTASSASRRRWCRSARLGQAMGRSAENEGWRSEEQFEAYMSTLSNDRRQLLERFTIVDMARKVVGVGSVGTRAFIVLLRGPRHSMTRSFCRSRRRRARSSRTTSPSRATATPGSGSSRASGSCRSRPTSSLAGPRGSRTTGSTTGDSSAT